MKLRVMNCKNCNAPLRLEGEKLICDFCNSAFDIEKDASDVAYDNIANAEELIRRSLSDRKAEMEAFFKKKEAETIAREEERERKHKEALKEIRRKARRKSIISFIRTLIILAICAVVMKVLIDKARDKKAERDAQKAATAANNRPKSYRVVPSELEKAGFLEYAKDLAIDSIKEKHEGAVIQSSKDIWNLVQEPQIESVYLITSDRGNGLYFIMDLVLETEDGRTTEGYDCVYLKDILVDQDGKVSLERGERCYGENSDAYDFFWRMDFDHDAMVEKAIDSKRLDAEKNYFVFDLTNECV